MAFDVRLPDEPRTPADLGGLGIPGRAAVPVGNGTQAVRRVRGPAFTSAAEVREQLHAAENRLCDVAVPFLPAETRRVPAPVAPKLATMENPPTGKFLDDAGEVRW